VYLGPSASIRHALIVDRTVAVMSDFICGANEADYHLRGVNFGRDCREPDIVADIRNVVAGDPSPDGKGTLENRPRHRSRPCVRARNRVF
jgi:prolyl-tRNA synthetase